MKKNIFITLIAVFTLSIFSCKEESEKKIITEEIQFTKEGELSIHNIVDSIPSKVVALDIEIADNDYERETGLMYRKTMEEKRGMLFIQKDFKPQSFYMKNTLIPLDIIYINDEFKIVSFQKNAKPLDETSLPSGKPAKYVLEINGGLSDKWNLKVGDSIYFKKN
ncbi:DUF192 domain-containing protein [Aquimarina sp. BL5]|uniref:DUF192 domain-containing protein n=1 Tax=Aquimarina sp. BL5 TaxID=1714860 RepID=UPI000E4BE459|nr:DUF192 domain-containing protein [Aquimarina sp. BL5]AXT50923.1 DUF192 domain-containing protein [Aquimarina sp. BL5]RKM87733.1 DUF192 domain-containing protein [Aquimarina sp. BL5]